LKKIAFIVCEGLIPRPLGAVIKVLNPRQIPYQNNHNPSALRRVWLITAVAVFSFGLAPVIHAEDFETVPEAEWNPDPVGPQYGVPDNKPFLTFSYGAAASWLTRIINQTERSNFVFRDFMPGLYFGMELRNLQYITPFLRLTAYYPLISTFNLMPQKPNTPMHIGADFYTGLSFTLSIKEVVRLYAGPALHMFFLNADRWNYFNIGASAIGGVELALSPGWTLLVDGAASLDNGNLGTNRIMEPFTTVFQYQAGFGFRYSKKMQNSRPLFAKKDNEDNAEILNRTY
jgi:hypothetical protein